MDVQSKIFFQLRLDCFGNIGISSAASIEIKGDIGNIIPKLFFGECEFGEQGERRGTERAFEQQTVVGRGESVDDVFAQAPAATSIFRQTSSAMARASSALSASMARRSFTLQR